MRIVLVSLVYKECQLIVRQTLVKSERIIYCNFEKEVTLASNSC